MGYKLKYTRAQQGLLENWEVEQGVPELEDVGDC